LGDNFANIERFTLCLVLALNVQLFIVCFLHVMYVSCEDNNKIYYFNAVIFRIHLINQSINQSISRSIINAPGDAPYVSLKEIQIAGADNICDYVANESL